VFTLHAVDDRERPALWREPKRHQVEPFFAKLPPTEVVPEACGGSHHRGRVLAGLGHSVGLIPPQYVKPFVKRAKNDRDDAGAISEAASRPGMASVPVKSAEQRAGAMILRHRELLTGQRTQAVNALRGHAGEFGVVAAKGAANIGGLLAQLAGDATSPAAALAMFRRMGEHIAALDRRIAELDADLAAPHEANPVGQRLAAIPGVGPLSAVTFALTVEPEQSESPRHFAAWLGLAAKGHSAGGRQRPGRISEAGNVRLRTLLVTGATAVIRCAKPGREGASPWLLQLLERKPRKPAAVAPANKMGRVIWSMMAGGQACRRQPAAA
jgi:transposase